jgi:hypothetical protein
MGTIREAPSLSTKDLGQMARLLANPCVNLTPGTLRLPVSFALQASVAGYVEH